MVRFTQHDTEMAKLIERLKKIDRWNDTLFVIVSDHGEEFNDHGSWGHGHSVYQELLHVPLLFHMPLAIPTKRISTTVSTVDVSPTILELAGLPALPKAEGHSLVGTMFGPPRVGPSVAFSEFMDERRVVRAGRWKFILRGNLTSSLFDLRVDPREKNQLDIHEHPIASRYLRILSSQFLSATDLAHWMDATQQSGAKLNAADSEMDDELKKQLEGLGYFENDG